MHPRTAEEKTAIEAYGGEIIFTPGDIIYSSSHIIETEPPAIATEKLMAILAAEGLAMADLHKAIDQLEGVRVHVIGDTIIDSYTHCALIGGMTKTPTMSVRYDKRLDFVGGAGIVVPPGDPLAFARAIEEMQTRREDLILAARNRIVEQFGLAALVERSEAALLGLLG